MNISKRIGDPALLEQCAEECAELAQVCLKLARKLRNENPTPAKEVDILNNLNEEVADVLVCIDAIVDDAGLLSHEAIESTQMSKRKRWEERINQELF